jgi:hypothetical protein
MARLRVKNTSTSNIGFSFGFLFKGSQALVEESRLSEGDRRMISSKKLFVEPEFPSVVKEKEVPEEVKPEIKEEVKVNVPENKGTVETVNPVASTPVATAQPAPVKPVEPGPVPAAPVAATQPEASVKSKFTEEQLKAKTKAELKELSKGLGADGRKRADMIAKILGAQEK